MVTTVENDAEPRRESRGFKGIAGDKAMRDHPTPTCFELVEG